MTLASILLCQVAIMSGAGPKRVKPQRGGKPKLGMEGEDLVFGEGGQVRVCACVCHERLQ